MSRKEPRRLEATAEQVRSIIAKTENGPLDAADRATLSALAETMFWLQGALESSKLSAEKLRRIIFGAKTEKTAAVLPTEPAGSAEESAAPAAPAEPDAPEPGDDQAERPKRKGHGRNGAAAYQGAKRIVVEHPDLKTGCSCPLCRTGTLYPLKPAVLIRIRGQAPLAGEIFEMARFRCNPCGAVFTTKAPPEAGTKKHDETAAATIGLLHYGTGLPFNRLDRLQEAVRVPVPASTQWEIARAAAAQLMPVFVEMTRQAAQFQLLHNDDTWMTVLSLTGKRRAKEAPADDPADRTGMFTTGIVAVDHGRRIALFFTGRKHAGENLREVLRHRAEDLSAPLQMCDGLSRNLPAEFVTVLANCLAHGRRGFVDVASRFPAECRHVLEVLGEVFRNDATAREQQMSDEQRLIFHQQHSGSLMADLAAWMKVQIDGRKVEPNSGLGAAIAYMEKHWPALTLFLRVAGAPIDNNLVERSLKRSIVHRKNSLFYRSLDGARVGDAFMSIIHTAELGGANPYDYLVSMLRHPIEVRASPADWMPWNYHEALARCTAAAA